MRSFLAAVAVLLIVVSFGCGGETREQPDIGRTGTTPSVKQPPASAKPRASRPARRDAVTVNWKAGKFKARVLRLDCANVKQSKASGVRDPRAACRQLRALTDVLRRGAAKDRCKSGGSQRVTTTASVRGSVAGRRISRRFADGPCPAQFADIEAAAGLWEALGVRDTVKTTEYEKVTLPPPPANAPDPPLPKLPPQDADPSVPRTVPVIPKPSPPRQPDLRTRTMPSCEQARQLPAGTVAECWQPK